MENNQQINTDQTPKQYILQKIANGESKGNIRIWITNMLKKSYLESDKIFYSEALKELDKH